MAIISNIVILGLVAGLGYILLTAGKRDPRLPPGPPTLPIIGNMHQLSTRKMFLKYTELAKIYGGLYIVKVGPSRLAIITDRRIAKELLDKKSAVTNNRPASTVAHDIIGNYDHVLMVPLGKKWQENRRFYHQNFMEAVCEKNYMQLMYAESTKMLSDFVLSPKNKMLHPIRYSNSIMTSIIYGIRAPSINSPLVTTFHQNGHNLAEILEIDSLPPVDIFPFLKLIPERFLGKWRSRATKIHNDMESINMKLIEHITQRREERGSMDTFVDRLLEDEKSDLSTHRRAFIAGGIIEAGTDTSSIVLMCFMQAMTKYPEVQKEAQREIDAIMGEDRMPNWSDYDNLPYVAAIVKECMRWRPVIPSGFPHLLDQDEWIDGKLLPKGTILILNAWGLQHDEETYPNPDVFDPARYVRAGRTETADKYANSSDYASRDHYVYGTGRRLCPGIYLAERTMFLGMAKLLWAFHFKKQIDPATGKPLEPDTDPVSGYDGGVVLVAKPFPCEMIPRSGARQETIKRELSRAETEVFSKYEDSFSI